jgi:hypothetical protein
MRVVLRHLMIVALPFALGLAAGWGFAYTQESCSRLVGFALAAKCRGVQLEWQVAFQTAGTLLGCLIAAPLGAWLELRNRHVVQHPDLQPGEPS